MAVLLAASLHAQTLAPADPDRYLQDIKTLSAPNMEGRGDGSKGLTRARDVLVHRYASLGLEPKGTSGFLQPFDIITGAELTSGNLFEVEARSKASGFVKTTSRLPFPLRARRKQALYLQAMESRRKSGNSTNTRASM
jgi:hypothetical protein